MSRSVKLILFGFLVLMSAMSSADSLDLYKAYARKGDDYKYLLIRNYKKEAFSVYGGSIWNLWIFAGPYYEWSRVDGEVDTGHSKYKEIPDVNQFEGTAWARYSLNTNDMSVWFQQKDEEIPVASKEVLYLKIADLEKGDVSNTHTYMDQIKRYGQTYTTISHVSEMGYQRTYILVGGTYNRSFFQNNEKKYQEHFKHINANMQRWEQMIKDRTDDPTIVTLCGEGVTPESVITALKIAMQTSDYVAFIYAGDVAGTAIGKPVFVIDGKGISCDYILSSAMSHSDNCERMFICVDSCNAEQFLPSRSLFVTYCRRKCHT